MVRFDGMTPRAITCPNCGAQIGDVCMTYIDPDDAIDLATRVPLYCADRIDAAFTRLSAHIKDGHPVKEPR